MQVLHASGTKSKSDASSILVAAMSNGFDTFGVAPLQQHGGRRPGAGRPRKGEVRPPKTRHALNSWGSSSYAYIVARLARDAQDGCREAAILLSGIHRGLISAHTAAVEMNYCQRRGVTGRGSENMARARDWALHKLLTRPDKGKAPPDGVNGAGNSHAGASSEKAQENAPGAASGVEG
jgi:hypothetical protein